MSDDNVIRLRPEGISIGDFMESVLAEVDSFGATRAYVCLFNAKDERAILRHQLTVADGALIAMDCIKMVNDDREDDEI